MTLGGKIHLFLKRNKMNQLELARRINISQSSLSQWMADKKLPSLEGIRILAKFMECNIEVLLDEEKNDYLSEQTKNN